MRPRRWLDQGSSTTVGGPFPVIPSQPIQVDRETTTGAPTTRSSVSCSRIQLASDSRINSPKSGLRVSPSTAMMLKVIKHFESYIRHTGPTKSTQTWRSFQYLKFQQKCPAGLDGDGELRTLAHKHVDLSRVASRKNMRNSFSEALRKVAGYLALSRRAL